MRFDARRTPPGWTGFFLDTGEELPADTVWADDETGEYAVLVRDAAGNIMVDYDREEARTEVLRGRFRLHPPALVLGGADDPLAINCDRTKPLLTPSPNASTLEIGWDCGRVLITCGGPEPLRCPQCHDEGVPALLTTDRGVTICFRCVAARLAPPIERLPQRHMP